MVIVNITVYMRFSWESGRIYFVNRIILNKTVSMRLFGESGKIRKNG